MAQRFQPKGEQAQWASIHDFLERRKPEIGDVVTFEDIEEHCGVDIRKNRTPFYKATNLWCEQHHRAFAPVTGIGYRVAYAAEHETLARKQHRKSRRSMKKGLTVIRNTDHSELSPADQARFHRMETAFSRQADVIRRLDIRQDQFEKTLDEGRRVTEATQREQQALKSRLERLEESLRERGIEP